MMDQPIRLSLYFQELRRRWLLIAIPFVIAVLGAILISLLQPVRYTASATMLAPKPQLVWRWDNRVSDVVDLRFDWRGEIMPLVTTEEVAQRVLDKVGGALQEPLDAKSLLQATKVKRGDGSLFSIIVESGNPEDAALLANAFAEALPETVADYYAGNLDLYSEALDEAQKQFEQWDQELLAFRGETGIALGLTGELVTLGEDKVFGNQSGGKQRLLLDISDRAALENVLQRVDVVLEALDAERSYPLLGLLDVPQLATYGLNFADLRELAQSDPVAFKSVVENLREQVQADLEQLTNTTRELQYQHASDLKKRDEILQIRGVWKETITTLERKKIELQMKRIIEGSRVQLIDEASPPARPSQPNWLLNLLVAAVGGLLGGFLLAVLAIYLSEPAAA